MALHAARQLHQMLFIQLPYKQGYSNMGHASWPTCNVVFDSLSMTHTYTVVINSTHSDNKQASIWSVNWDSSKGVLDSAGMQALKWIANSVAISPSSHPVVAFQAAREQHGRQHARGALSNVCKWYTEIVLGRDGGSKEVPHSNMGERRSIAPEWSSRLRGGTAGHDQDCVLSLLCQSGRRASTGSGIAGVKVGNRVGMHAGAVRPGSYPFGCTKGRRTGQGNTPTPTTDSQANHWHVTAAICGTERMHVGQRISAERCTLLRRAAVEASSSS
eukprot:355617-Chlamydomonas_euryale.AAC.11